MKLRTEINIHKQELSIHHQKHILLTGSCFSENIGEKLKDYKFSALINPMGISYNPISLHQLLSLDSQQLDENFNLIESNNEIYFHYNFHSKFNSLSAQEFKEKIKEAYRIQSDYLNKKPILIITYGTAWVYELKSNKQVTNNCHKQAASLFNKRLLSKEEIIDSWESLNKKLEKSYRHKFNFIFTISPVRHIKDGFIENQLSKSTLNLAIHQICSNNKNCSYFPSYEIMMDDLRDYRFYKDDLLHPTSMAIDYIWELFSKAYFSKQTQDYNQKIKQINQSLQHRPFNLNSAIHQRFIKKLKTQIEHFSAISKINFDKELEKLTKQLKDS